MMPKSVKRLSDDIMLYLFELEADSDFRLIQLEIIRLQAVAAYAASAEPKAEA